MFPRSEFYYPSIFAGLVAWLSPRMKRYCRIVKRVDFGQNTAGTARCHHGMADGMIWLILSDAPGPFCRWGSEHDIKAAWFLLSMERCPCHDGYFLRFLYHIPTLSHRPFWFCIRYTGFGVLWSQLSEYIYEMKRTTAAIPNWGRTQVYKWYHIQMSSFLAK